MIVDTHVHYAETPSTERPHDVGGTREQPLPVDVVLENARSVGVQKLVQVTPSMMGYDNRYGLEGAERHPDEILGVFGRFDPLAPDVDRRLCAFMAQPGMLGVRIQTRPGTPSERWLSDRMIDAFLESAQRRGVTVSIYAIEQPRELHAVARAFPGLQIINEHMTLSKREPSADAFRQWPDVLALARESNVWTKVSMFPEAAPHGESFPFPTSLRRFQELYDFAGPERLIWGSNYPPVKKACSYKQALDFIATAATFLSEADRKRILGSNFLSASSLARHTAV